MVRHPSKGFGGKTLEVSPDLKNRKQSNPQDKENVFTVKNRKAFGAKKYTSPKTRKPFEEISN